MIAQQRLPRAQRAQAAVRPRAPRRSVIRPKAYTSEGTYLVGDIGGTNARLSLWATNGGSGGKELCFKVYPTGSTTEFDDVVETFLKEEVELAGQPKAAAFAVAGAVSNNVCNMTNTKWVVDGGRLARNLGFRVAVLNDFEAQGYGALAVSSDQVVVINDVPPQDKAPKVVCGPGTGLGAAQLMWDTATQAYRVWPGEGAHATFAPRGWKQRALADFVTTREGHCEIEQVACGSGLARIYEFLLTDETFNRPTLLPAKPLTPVEVTQAALAGEPLAVEAVHLFLSIIGAEAGAMALRSLAKGGVYICGGIAPRLLPFFEHGGFLDAFLNHKGREPFTAILRDVPVYVVVDDKCGLLGTLEYAKQLSRGA